MASVSRIEEMMKNPCWYHFTFFHNRKLAKFNNRGKGWKTHIGIIKKFRILVSALPTVLPCKFVNVDLQKTFYLVKSYIHTLLYSDFWTYYTEHECESLIFLNDMLYFINWIKENSHPWCFGWMSGLFLFLGKNF